MPKEHGLHAVLSIRTPAATNMLTCSLIQYQQWQLYTRFSQIQLHHHTYGTCCSEQIPDLVRSNYIIMPLTVWNKSNGTMSWCLWNMLFWAPGHQTATHILIQHRQCLLSCLRNTLFWAAGHQQPRIKRGICGYLATPTNGWGYLATPTNGWGYLATPTNGWGYLATPTNGCGYLATPMVEGI